MYNEGAVVLQTTKHDDPTDTYIHATKLKSKFGNFILAQVIFILYYTGERGRESSSRATNERSGALPPSFLKLCSQYAFYQGVWQPRLDVLVQYNSRTGYLTNAGSTIAYCDHFFLYKQLVLQVQLQTY